MIKTVGIAGAGVMGAGIAQVCASAGYDVILYDINPTVLSNAVKLLENSLKKIIELGKINQEQSEVIKSRIKYTDKDHEMKAELIIEAIIEKAAPKISLLNGLMRLNPESTIFATNTSSIPITQIAAGLDNPSRLVGIHFFNPAPVMKLVEIIKGAKTDNAIMPVISEFVVTLKKHPVIAADAPGFIVNRIARLYYVESLKILEEQLCDLETIDNIMESSGFRMGPFRLMDLIGVETNYSVTESQYALFNQEPRFRPSRIQKQKVEAGLYGKKTKEGFYKYE